MEDYHGWARAWGGDVNVDTQVQNVIAFNGAGNVNAGDFLVSADQDVGDVLGKTPGPINDHNVMVDVDMENGVDVSVQVQNVVAFNGHNNVNAGTFAVDADQSAGDGQALWDGLLSGNDSGVDSGTQVQNVVAFNGSGNINFGNFQVTADQNVGDFGNGHPGGFSPASDIPAFFDEPVGL